MTRVMRGFQKRICSAMFPLQVFTGFVVPFNLFMSCSCLVFAKTTENQQKKNMKTKEKQQKNQRKPMNKNNDDQNRTNEHLELKKGNTEKKQ